MSHARIKSDQSDFLEAKVCEGTNRLTFPFCSLFRGKGPVIGTYFTVAHICHGKTYFSTAKLTFSRQNLLFHGKTYFFTNLLFHGKTYFSTAKLTFPRQNLLFHGKTYFSTAKLTFSRQNLTAKLTFSRQNLLFHGKTYFPRQNLLSTAKLTFSRQNFVKELGKESRWRRLIATTKTGLKIIRKRCS